MDADAYMQADLADAVAERAIANFYNKRPQYTGHLSRMVPGEETLITTPHVAELSQFEPEEVAEGLAQITQIPASALLELAREQATGRSTEELMVALSGIANELMPLTEQGQEVLALADAQDGDELALAGSKPAEYADVDDEDFADPGYQEDGKKRYPVNTAERVRAAWEYIHHEHDAEKYTAKQLRAIKDKIIAAAHKHGVELADDGDHDEDETEPVHASAQAELDLQLARAGLSREEYEGILGLARVMADEIEPGAGDQIGLARHMASDMEAEAEDDEIGLARSGSASDEVARITSDRAHSGYFSSPKG